MARKKEIQCSCIYQAIPRRRTVTTNRGPPTRRTETPRHKTGSRRKECPGFRVRAAREDREEEDFGTFLFLLNAAENKCAAMRACCSAEWRSRGTMTSELSSIALFWSLSLSSSSSLFLQFERRSKEKLQGNGVEGVVGCGRASDGSPSAGDGGLSPRSGQRGTALHLQPRGSRLLSP